LPLNEAYLSILAVRNIRPGRRACNVARFWSLSLQPQIPWIDNKEGWFFVIAIIQRLPLERAFNRCLGDLRYFVIAGTQDQIAACLKICRSGTAA
jgi:hypothetical protein